MLDPIREAQIRAQALKLKLQRKGLIPNPAKWWPCIPFPKQQVLLDGDFQEAFYGGSLAGGKTFLLLMAACKYADYGNYRALILRRTTNALKAARGLVEIAREFFSGIPGMRYNEKDMVWRFPSGATLKFGFLEHDSHLQTYQGGGYHFVGFDELSQFTQYQYTYLFSRLRKDMMSADIPLRIYSTSNPDPDAMWIYEHFIENATPTGQFCQFKEHSGYVLNQEVKWTSVFVPASLDDNPGIDKEAYLASLAHLAKTDPVLLQRLLMGDWLARQEGDIYKLRECWHVITRSAFARVVGTPTIPSHWRVGLGLDWGATKESLVGAVWVARAAANIKHPALRDAKFVFCEATWEAKIPLEVHQDILTLERRHNLSPRQFDFRIMSHDALTERQIFERQYQMPFIQAVHPVDVGISVIQNELAIRNEHIPHPFNEGIMGYPNLYLIVEDSEGRQFENPDKSNPKKPYLLSPPRTSEGLIVLREDMPAYRWLKDKTPSHDRRGCLDALRYIGWRFFPSRTGLTKTEREDQGLPYPLRMDNIQQIQDVALMNQKIVDRQLQLHFQKMIKRAVAAKSSSGQNLPVYRQNPFNKF